MPVNTDSRWAQRHAKKTSSCPHCEQVIWRCNCAACVPGAPKWKTPSKYQMWSGLGAVHVRCWSQLYRASQLARAEAERAAASAESPAQVPAVERGTVTFVKGGDGATIRLSDAQRQQRPDRQDR